MAVPAVTDLLCILIDSDFRHTIGGLFVVEVPSDGLIRRQDQGAETKRPCTR